MLKVNEGAQAKEQLLFAIVDPTWRQQSRPFSGAGEVDRHVYPVRPLIDRKLNTNTDKIDYDRFLSNLTFNWYIELLKDNSSTYISMIHLAANIW